jgi:hypothetical protein
VLDSVWERGYVSEEEGGVGRGRGGWTAVPQRCSRNKNLRLEIRGNNNNNNKMNR